MIIIQASSSILHLGAISSENDFTSATPRLCSGLDQRKTELNTFWDRRMKKYDNNIFCRAVARLPAHRLEFNYFSRVSLCVDWLILWWKLILTDDMARPPAHRLEFNYFSRVSLRLGGVTLWSDDNWWLPRDGRGLRQQWWNRIKTRWTTTITNYPDPKA